MQEIKKTVAIDMDPNQDIEVEARRQQLRDEYKALSRQLQDVKDKLAILDARRPE